VPGRLHPAVLADRERRAADLPLRLADATAFAGSLTFVYLHAIGFGVWMLALEHEHGAGPGGPRARAGAARRHPSAGRRLAARLRQPGCEVPGRGRTGG
jgi:hypothetical protein